MVRIAAITACLLACSSSSSTLRVDLKTDFVPLAELTRAVSTLEDQRVEYAVEGSESFFDGVRIAELDLEPGTYELHVELFGSFGPLAERRFTLAVDGDLGVTALITRDCRQVDCDADETCVAGECVPTTCTASGDPDCPIDECTAASECPAAPAPCATASCIEGVCLFAGTCDADAEVCLPERGCEARPEPLTDRGLLVRYPLVEPVGAPVASTASPLDLAFDPPSPATIQAIREPTGAGLSFTGLSGDERICAPIAGSAVEGLDRTTEGTIEAVARLREGDDNSSRVVAVGLSGDWGFSIGFRSDGRLLIFSANTTAEFYGIWPLGPDDGLHHVYTVVVDSTQPTIPSVARLFIDGRPGPANEGLALLSGPIAVPPEASLCLGNRDIGGRGLDGDLLYAAYYDVALSDQEVLSNAGRLLVSND